MWGECHKGMHSRPYNTYGISSVGLTTLVWPASPAVVIERPQGFALSSKALLVCSVKSEHLDAAIPGMIQ